MRRLAALVLVVSPGFVGTACDPKLSRKASGAFTGTGVLDPSSGGCDFVSQWFADYVRRQAQPGGAFLMEGCVEDVPPPFPFDGTFVLTTQAGAQLRGDVAGFIEAGDGRVRPFDFTVTVTDGTKRFAGSSGTVHIEGTWELLFCPLCHGGPIDGTLFAGLQGPNGQRLTL